MKITKLHIATSEKLLVDIGFCIQESLALVGQSGSGKSLTLKAILGMLSDSMACSFEYEADFVCRVGETLGFVPQNPFTALSPLTKIKDQFFVGEQRVRELFSQVDLDEALLERYPPELSGGQLQRVVIAMALEAKPKLLMLDEPTTALDPSTREKILSLLHSLQKELGFYILFVTHDMSAAKNLCKEICVIKEGKVVEYGMMADVLANPQAEYTKVLIESNFSNRIFRR